VTRFRAHIINHTHWDREWFLTSIYTNHWIPGLIDKISSLAQKNLEFHYFLDGQTLVIEDLLKKVPHYREVVERLVRGGTLAIGPYYCQPDWRLTSPEALLRNLLHGARDMHVYNASTDTGWLVDTFGHISQSPQIHNLFGIQAVYVWRGVPRLQPYFHWVGPDGSRLFTINLFGGYRNLYGVTHAPEIAVARLQAELNKLGPHYPTGDIPLFDGYDLENSPEDPLVFFLERSAHLPQDLRVYESTPAGFAAYASSGLEHLPAILGELNSGKYGAVFPGTLSTRTYLKVLARDCEHTLYRLCEPLAVLAYQAGRPYPSERYEAWSRSLLRQSIHDCICGVSIDQVHEKMEFRYREAFNNMRADLDESLAYILDGFAPGTYCLSTNPFLSQSCCVHGDRVYPIRTQGVGVWPVGEGFAVHRPQRPSSGFSWANEYYEAQILSDGRLRVGPALLGSLRVYEECGDAYSEEAGAFLGVLQPQGDLTIEQESGLHAVIRIDYRFAWPSGSLSASVRLSFDPSPLIKWQVELEPRGVDYRLEMLFETGRVGQVYAGMPFDIVPRPLSDEDLLPRQLEGQLAKILLGQRELGAASTFPFQDFVAVTGEATTTAVLAKGLHSYQAAEDGSISITLLRAVEWLTKPDLHNRVGDAGPFFYVPDARCERRFTHELAVCLLQGGVDDPEFQALNAGYQNPPLVVETTTPGSRTSWGFFQEDLPMTGLHLQGSRPLARLFNPTAHPQPLSKPYLTVGISGDIQEPIRSIAPKQILTLALPAPAAALAAQVPGTVQIWNPPQWRVGPNQGIPDSAVIQELSTHIQRLEAEIEVAQADIPNAQDQERYQCQHRLYMLQREMLEYRLSRRLNELKLGMQGRITPAYLFELDEEVARIGWELNQMRIQRRIYDYIVQVCSQYAPLSAPLTAPRHAPRPPDIPQLLRLLGNHQVRYVLTGSVALQVYGIDIGAPGDLDITPALDPENLARLTAALLDMEAALDPDGLVGHWETHPDGERKWVVDQLTPEIRASRAAWRPDPADAGTMDHLFLTRHGNFDVVPDLSGQYDRLIQRAVQTIAFGQMIWVAHIDDLLAALTVPRRKKDAARVHQLRDLQRKR
jgi:alpha-mannosidase